MSAKIPTPIEKAIAIIGGTNATARALGIKPPAVSRWRRTGLVPVNRCPDLERLTNGEVTRAQLRPDIFGKLTAKKKR